MTYHDFFVKFEINDASVVCAYDAPNERYGIRWTDGINEWTENFLELSTALARLAALVKCGEEDWSAFFAHDEAEFSNQADSFFDQVIG